VVWMRSSKRSEILNSSGVRIEIEHVVYGLRNVALHLHNTGTLSITISDQRIPVKMLT
jgi:hypothetical protein